MSPEYFTYHEVAAMFAVSVRTVKRWVAEGRLEPVRFGYRTARFTREEIDRFAVQQLILDGLEAS